MSTIWLVLLAGVLQAEADLPGPVPHSGDFYYAYRVHPYLNITGRELFEHPKHQKRGTVTAIKRLTDSPTYEASTTKKKQVWLGPSKMPAMKTYCVQLTTEEAAEVARKSPEFRAFEFGFGQAKWGWGKDEVKESEAGPLLSEEEDSLIYHDEVLGLDAFVAYLFVDGQFYLGRYLFAEEHTELNKYVSDASAVAEALRENRPHKVPLSPQALAVLEPLREGKTPFVFESPSKKSDGPVLWLGRACRRVRKRCEFHFTPHDLRRTAASGMAALGTPRETLSKILNHKSADGSVTAIYDRYDREAEMRRALFAWGSKLEAILDQKSPKVIRIG